VPMREVSVMWAKTSRFSAIATTVPRPREQIPASSRLPLSHSLQIFLVVLQVGHSCRTDTPSQRTCLQNLRVCSTLFIHKFQSYLINFDFRKSVHNQVGYLFLGLSFDPLNRLVYYVTNRIEKLRVPHKKFLIVKAWVDTS
jgi:hypothetical protein